MGLHMHKQTQNLTTCILPARHTAHVLANKSLPLYSLRDFVFLPLRTFVCCIWESSSGTKIPFITAPMEVALGTCKYTLMPVQCNMPVHV